MFLGLLVDGYVEVRDMEEREDLGAVIPQTNMYTFQRDNRQGWVKIY